jgi:hypothetical protein
VRPLSFSAGSAAVGGNARGRLPVLHGRVVLSDGKG